MRRRLQVGIEDPGLVFHICPSLANLGALLVILLLLCAVAEAKPAAKRPPTDEPFDSFRALDAKFTKLDQEFSGLKKDLASDAQKRGKSARKAAQLRWRHSEREMRRTLIGVERICRHMESHYRAKGERFGERLFAMVRARAERMARNLRSMEKSESVRAAQHQADLAGHSLLSLVLGFQAVSSDYAAANCDPGEWACGQPKPQPNRPGYPKTAAKWVCVPRRQQCGGLLGPRTPLLGNQSATNK